MHHHLVLGPRIVLPPVHGLQVHRAELPLPDRVVEPRPEPAQLLVVGHREPVFAQQYAVFQQHLLDDRGLPQKQRMFLRRAESHHLLHAGAVVPRPVEQHDLALGGQVGDIALVVPLAAFTVARRRQRRDPGDAWAEVFGDPLDRSALAGGVATLEDDHNPRAGMPHPRLQLDEFCLQSEQFGFVNIVGDLARCRLLFLRLFWRAVGYCCTHPPNRSSGRQFCPANAPTTARLPAVRRAIRATGPAAPRHRSSRPDRR